MDATHARYALKAITISAKKGSLRTTIGIGRNGSFAKFCVDPIEQVFLLPQKVTLEQGELFQIELADENESDFYLI